MRRGRGALVVTVAGLLVISGCVGGYAEIGGFDGSDDDVYVEDAENVDGNLEIHHIDAGQADATLLVTPSGETILIDTGDWRQDGQGVIDYLEAQEIDRIDHLVATHAHADHIGGHAAVIEHFEEHGEGVGAAYDSGVISTSQTYDGYLDAIEEHDVRLFRVAEGDSLPLENDPVEATVLNPPEDARDDVDVDSVVLSVEFRDFTYLTTGDAERTAEQRLVGEYGDDLASDAYQAGHHGSSTSSTDPFLEAVDPEVAIVSSALESQYGHPHDEVLESFAVRGVETYWTGVHGDVVLTTDGDDVSVTTEREATTDPEALLERKHDARSQSESLEPRLSSSESSGDGVSKPAVDTAPAPSAASGPVVDGASAPTTS